jgi:uncharacterized protein (TIGR02270 family)
MLQDILTQHTEESSFLWLLRDRAVHAPHYTLKDLARLDNRVEAHLDGLRIAGDVGWDICKENLSCEEPGEIFAAAVLAFESNDEERIQTVLGAGSNAPELSRAIVSALGWLPWHSAEPHARNLTAAESPSLRRIGMAAYAVHRKDLGPLLLKGFGSSDALLRSRSLKAAGELGRTDLLAFVQDHLKDKDEKCRFYAAWSAALLGSEQMLPVLREIAVSKGSYAERACTLALRRMPEAHAWLRELRQQEQYARLAVQGAGALGDPAAVPWLIEMMAVPELARVAGEAFSMLTGLDLAYEDLETDWPEGFVAGPTEDPEDEDVALDPDEDLPWPAPALIAQWWETHKGRFAAGNRYLAGQPIAAGQLQQVLLSGYQRQRAAAALELALFKPEQSLFEVRTAGFRPVALL